MGAVLAVCLAMVVGASFFAYKNLYFAGRVVKGQQFLSSCITASGSRNHQLLAAMKKRRKSPNLPQDEGAPTCLQHQLIPPPPQYLGQGGTTHPSTPFDLKYSETGIIYCVHFFFLFV
jgi:hypothetical protein